MYSHFRYEKAIEPVTEGMKIVQKQGVKIINYPETKTPIPESGKAKLKVRRKKILM